jgi:hypothetical protein
VQLVYRPPTSLPPSSESRQPFIPESIRGSGTSGRLALVPSHQGGAIKIGFWLGFESVTTDSSRPSSVYSLSSSAISPTTLFYCREALVEQGLPFLRFPKDLTRHELLQAKSCEKEPVRGRKEEGRAARYYQPFIPPSSFASSSSTSAATSAHSANLQRGRPPSIVHVFEESSAVGDVLQTLRPFKSMATAPELIIYSVAHQPRAGDPTLNFLHPSNNIILLRTS